MHKNISNMPMPFVGYLGIILAVGSAILMDGFTTATSIISIIGATNFFSITFAIMGAIILVSFLTSTKAILSSELWFLKMFWFIAILIDFYTTIVGVIHFVILKNGLDIPINLSPTIQDMPSGMNVIITLGLTVLISGATLAYSFILESLESLS